MSLNHISENDIHNITSGQVITDLSNIVKEFVENSIDANASSITIIFKRFGLEGLEIHDNGDGINPDDFENLCKKNYTSKLENYEGLIDVKTLGFRGEALNSICNISEMHIITSTAKGAPRGWELSYDNYGKLTEKKLVNQSKGTLIKINEIFKNLPVRKLNLEKNYRKEFQKCLHMLTSYLLILTKVRFIIYNIDVSGKKKVMMKTANNLLIKDNIINVFGSTGLQGLEELKHTLILDSDHSIYLNGMLSNSSIGNGRLSKDRQYIYINRRPVEFKKIIKLINTTYKKFNYLQYPMILLNFDINEHLIDINVTPDKKIVLLSNVYENLLVNKLELFLEEFWDNKGTYNIPIDDSYQDKIKERNSSLTQPKLESFALFQDDEIVDPADAQLDVVERVAVRNSRVVKINDNENESNTFENHRCNNKSQNTEDKEEITEHSRKVYSKDNLQDNLENNRSGENYKKEEIPKKLSMDNVEETNDVDCENENSPDKSTPETLVNRQKIKESDESSLIDIDHENESIHLEKNIINDQYNSSIEVDLRSNNIIDCDNSPYCEDHSNNILEPLFVNNEVEDDIDLYIEKSVQPKFEEKDKNENVAIYNQKVRISDIDLKPRHGIKRMKVLKEFDGLDNSIEKSDIYDKGLSEQLLGLSIHKNDFTNMEIVGQFNKGFIIVYKKDTNDILIIDQHASDEKYNFEKLIDETTFENQPLVIPRKLELSSIEKLTIMNNLQIFEKNGFKFKSKFKSENEDENEDDDEDENRYDNSKQEEMYLTSLPYSKNTIFDIKDLNELIQLVDDRVMSASSIPRPTKVRSMFAMRACRSSIMIGQSLNTPKMENIVQHLATLDKPWNCPHGRPTMRHLVKIDQWKPFNKDYQY